MAIDQHVSTLISTTVNAFNGEVTAVSPMDGISLIDSWLSFFHTVPQFDMALADSLNQLKTELQSGSLEGSRIQHILDDLTEQAKQIASAADEDSKPKLTVLAEALDGFCQQVSGSSGPANTGGKAPISSTVGGESTNQGAGISALL